MFGSISLTAGRSCSGGATGEATPRPWTQQLYLDKAQGWCPQPLPLLHWHAAAQPSPTFCCLQQLHVTTQNFPFFQGRKAARWECPLSDWDGSSWVQLLPSFPQHLCQSSLSRRQMAVERLLWHLQLSCWLPFLYFIILWDVTVADVPGWWELAGRSFLAPGQTRVRQDKAPLY